jgi:hypothetical protein
MTTLAAFLLFVGWFLALFGGFLMNEDENHRINVGLGLLVASLACMFGVAGLVS